MLNYQRVNQCRKNRCNSKKFKSRSSKCTMALFPGNLYRAIKASMLWSSGLPPVAVSAPPQLCFDWSIRWWRFPGSHRPGTFRDRIPWSNDPMGETVRPKGLIVHCVNVLRIFGVRELVPSHHTQLLEDYKKIQYTDLVRVLFEAQFYHGNSLLSSLQSFNQLERDVVKSSGKQTEIALETESPKRRITGSNLFLPCDCFACCDATQCHDVSETIHIQHIYTGLQPQQNSRKPTYIELHFPSCSTILHHFPSFSQDFWVNYDIN